MNYWYRYTKAFQNRIIENQSYQQIIQQTLKKIDQSNNPCYAKHELQRLKNHLLTKSEGCTSLKKLAPGVVYDYKGETQNRSKYFGRESESLKQQCKRKTQLDKISIHQFTERQNAIQRQVTQRQKDRQRQVTQRQKDRQRQVTERQKLYSCYQKFSKP